jgi:hypothetical protein
MGLKRGYIVEDDTPVTRGPTKIRRFRLSSGDHVYLPLDVAYAVVTRHSPAEEFFFVEKGLLGRTAWAGNLHDVREVIRLSILPEKDFGGLRLPTYEWHLHWEPPVEEDDHAKVGARMPALAEMLRNAGTPETADTLTVESWVEHATTEGWCVANRSDALHGWVWCGREEAPNHAKPHIPTCPTCHNVKSFMFMIGRQVGEWGEQALGR